MSLEENFQTIKELGRDVYTSSKKRLSDVVKFSIAAPTYYRNRGDNLEGFFDKELFAMLGTLGGTALGVVASLPFSIYTSYTDGNPGMVIKVSLIPTIISFTTNQISAFYEAFRAKKQKVLERQNLIDEVERYMKE